MRGGGWIDCSSPQICDPPTRFFGPNSDTDEHLPPEKIPPHRTDYPPSTTALLPSTPPSKP